MDMSMMSLLFLWMLLPCASARPFRLYKEVCPGKDLIIREYEASSISTFRRAWFFLPVKKDSDSTPVISTEWIRVSTENGTVLDPRFEISSTRFIIRGVTEGDEGYFSYEKSTQANLIRVSLKDCSRKVKKEFGSQYEISCPSDAYFLEYTQLENTDGSQNQVLWNRTDPELIDVGGRGMMRYNEWRMNQITYDYVGYYTFKDKNHKYISSIKLTVEEKDQYYNKVQGQDLNITFWMDPTLFFMAFKSDARHSEPEVLMKAGDLQVHNMSKFHGRLQKLDVPVLHLTIEDLQPSDSGTFTFTDWGGNKALVVSVKVEGSYMRYKDVCYGADLTIYVDDTVLGSFRRHRWFFLPVRKGSDMLTVPKQIQVSTENGTVLDPRFEISSEKFIMRHVTERDDGILAYEKTVMVHLFKVIVKDCANKVTREFGSDYSINCPNNAYSLAFTPLGNTNGSQLIPQSQILWNRTNPQVNEARVRGRMQNNRWRMNQITYEYVGYYNFYDKKRSYISSIRLKVESKHQYYDKVQGEDLELTFSVDPALLVDMTFKSVDEDLKPEILMKAGELQVHSVQMFDGRLQKQDGPTLHITIEDLEPSDSGTFTFYDWKGNKALVMDLYVAEGFSFAPYVDYIVTAVGILSALFCCCCVRKHCCKKNTGKNHSVPDSETAPVVPIYNHDPQDHTRPSTSAHPSASHGPTYPLYHNEPRRNSQQPLAGTTAPQEPPPYESFLSSDAEPLFELKGTTFSAPLSSDTPYADVYTSDKLNFL